MRRAAALCLILLIVGALRAGAGELVDAVDPFIGTGGHGHTFPGPTLPFGMVQLSPDTRLTGWDGCSGYHYSDTTIHGFSHTHLSGTGVSDYGDVLLMPVAGDVDPCVDGAASPFDKSSERAAAGYYAVHLLKGGVDVELTATPRSGLHRYVFPAGTPVRVFVDLEHRDRLLDADLRVVDDCTVEGFRRSSAWARDQVVYFTARFSRPFTATRLAAGDTAQPGRMTQAVLSFGQEGGELLVQVGISAVDVAGARRNLQAEWAGFDFPAAREQAREAWRRELAPFVFEGADPAQTTVLATALYHSFLAPNLFSDVDGRYRGMDLAVHTAPERDQYTVFSLWDTYRATHPLFTLVQRERTGDFVSTMLAQFKEGGRLPVWELAANETDCMIGYHSVSVIADAYLKGLVAGDEDLALQAMLASAGADRFGLAAYRRDGYIGADLERESVSRTLEYAYDDACIARFAASLGRDDVAVEFGRRAQGWRHLYDPQSRCFRPRHNGRWLEPFDPRRVDFNYTEANAWQYRFGAPQHQHAHAALLGGDAACEAVLDSLFTLDSATTGRDQADITGLIGQYAHGNEPSHHIAWLSHFNGRPDRSAERVARIRDAFYTPAPDGLIGNEDCGQMSSWYVLAASGLYDVAPTSGQWLVIPPLHERMSLRLADGRTFTTRRVGAGAIERVTFDGRPLTRSYLTHAEVAGGGELVFYLGQDGHWGAAPTDRPGTPALDAPLLAAPWAEAPADRFRGDLTVRLASADAGTTLLWTDDPQQDPHTGRLYRAPLLLRDTTTLRFVATDGERWSPVTTSRYDALPPDWTVTVESTPNSQYTAGGPDALIDGRRGTPSWATGGWQGYQGQDFVAVLDLGRPTPLHLAGAGFLQDMGSWIVLPTELVVEVSEDGTTFHEVGRVGHDVPAETDDVVIRDLAVEFDEQVVRAVRFRAVGFGVLPEWHLGAGGESFVFVDEWGVGEEQLVSNVGRH
jgi:predicted alpha-1,2-mannosidase